MAFRTGSRKFASTKKGMNAARRQAKKMGMDITVGGKKKVVGRNPKKSGMTKVGSKRRRRMSEY